MCVYNKFSLFNISIEKRCNLYYNKHIVSINGTAKERFYDLTHSFYDT